MMRQLILLLFGFSSIVTVHGYFSAVNLQERPDSFLDELVVFDQYLSSDRIKTKQQSLKNLSAALRDRPLDTAYIVAFGTLKKSKCDSVSELGFVRNYLVNVLRVNPRRFVLIDGGIGDLAQTEFYLVPSGVNFPEESIRRRINDVLNPVGEAP